MLRVESLTVTPKYTPLTFDVASGECLGLLGFSATHTSRLLVTVAGLARPLSGSVLIDGVDVIDGSATARRQLAITRTPCVPVQLRLREYLQTVIDSRRSHGMPSRTTAAAALERLRLDGGRMLSTPAARSEAALAAAILPSARLVILDEPFHAVSADTRTAAIEWIRALAADSVGVLIGGREERDVRAVSHTVISTGRAR